MRRKSPGPSSLTADTSSADAFADPDVSICSSGCANIGASAADALPLWAWHGASLLRRLPSGQWDHDFRYLREVRLAYCRRSHFLNGIIGVLLSLRMDVSYGRPCAW